MVKVILKITVMIRLIVMVKDINKKEDLESSNQKWLYTKTGGEVIFKTSSSSFFI